jgi:hypothetical protein
MNEENAANTDYISANGASPMSISGPAISSTNGNHQPPQPVPLVRSGYNDRTVHIQKISPHVRITPQARRYAIAELARRAGVPEAFYQQWKISVEVDRTVVHLPGNVERQIVFPHAAPDHFRELSDGHVRWVHRSWMTSSSAPPVDGIPDFIVPFTKDEQNCAGKPLFILSGNTKIECTVDLPLSTLLTLSRWEETLDAERDAHGRFIAEQSIALKGAFLQRPIVDECGLAFEQALKALFPAWAPRERTLRVKLSHDADHLGIPFRLKNTLRHITHYRQPINSARDIVGLLTKADPSDLHALREIVSLSLDRTLDSAVYWKASLPSARDSGYDPRHRKIQRMIAWLTERNVESGVQPGYDTFRSPEKLRREVQILREVLGDGPLGGRQHYLRWCPDTWIHWETCGLAYDSSLCFADHVGFRAGTCVPYRPWLFSLNREADLLEIPLIVMDRTLLVYMKLDCQASIRLVKECIQRCSKVGGLFTLVWHNNNLLDPLYRSLYLQLLPLLQNGARYDWRSEHSRIGTP